MLLDAGSPRARPGGGGRGRAGRAGGRVSASSGVTVLQCKSRDGRVDVVDLCARLFALDVIAVLLEGGGELTGAFVEAGLVDRVAAFVAPRLLGRRRGADRGGRPRPVGCRRCPPAERLSRARPLGEDWLLRRRRGPDRADMFTGLVEEVGRVLERAGLAPRGAAPTGSSRTAAWARASP